MPAYSTLRDFVAAIKSGRTHITRSLDAFFSNLDQVTLHQKWTTLEKGNWSAKAPSWLEAVLIADVGLTAPEALHVVRWPSQELEKARDAAVRAVKGAGVVKGKAPKFFWELYNGTTPRTLERVSSAGVPEIVFQSPRAAVVVKGDDVSVHDVNLD